MTFKEPEERLHAPQVQLPYQLPDDVSHDGEDGEVALKPLPPPEQQTQNLISENNFYLLLVIYVNLMKSYN